jgi:hypothetical protein
MAVVTMSGRRTISSHISTGWVEAINVAEVTLAVVKFTGGHSGIFKGIGGDAPVFFLTHQDGDKD